VKWHQKYLKKLEKQKKSPAHFHRSRTSHKINNTHLRHFKEHVIEAIPFHKSFITTHKKKIQAIETFITKKTYKKLAGISISLGTVPEYFVYDKLHKAYFFIAEHLDKAKKKWISKTRKIVDTLVLEGN
jgi:hypothetical protein